MKGTGSEPTAGDEGADALKLAREKIAEKNRRLKKLREQLEEKDREIASLRRSLTRTDACAAGGVRPENIVWIFCTARSGSTWLASMMADLQEHTLWHEPLVGELFGYLYYVRGSEGHRRSRHFILGRHRETWLGSVRSFVLDGAASRFPEAAGEGYLVIKEPNGSIGAPLLMEALPESRMIFLIRDPRDVVASSLDANSRGSWRDRKGKANLIDGQPDDIVEKRAHTYIRYVGNAKQAYDDHQGRKVLVKYEDLRADTLGTLSGLYNELGMAVEDKELLRVVEKHAWENIPEKDKGEGKFYRKATPGGWREDLTPEQVGVVERITAPLLKEFYP